MKVLFWFLLLTPSTGWSHISSPADMSCEAILDNEFSHAPDDARQGLISQNVPLTVESLLAAYPRGIFPWGTNFMGFGRWHKPPNRGVLELDKVHISERDLRYIKKALKDPELTVTFDRDFRGVMELCSTVDRFRTDPSTGEKFPDGVWITQEFKDAYAQLHEGGHAHSVEVWRKGKLVGGLYGVFINGVFTGESMFYLEPDVTKLAFNALIERMRAGGHQFIDTQLALGLAKKWGAKLVPREEFEVRLAAAQQQNLKF
jgi:leucyl/phenylalanyl-tRNA--protein transferase